MTTCDSQCRQFGPGILSCHGLIRSKPPATYHEDEKPFFRLTPHFAALCAVTGRTEASAVFPGVWSLDTSSRKLAGLRKHRPSETQAGRPRPDAGKKRSCCAVGRRTPPRQDLRRPQRMLVASRTPRLAYCTTCKDPHSHSPLSGLNDPAAGLTQAVLCCCRSV